MSPTDGTVFLTASLLCRLVYGVEPFAEVKDRSTIDDCFEFADCCIPRSNDTITR